jgi:hypothetical protein
LRGISQSSQNYSEDVIMQINGRTIKREAYENIVAITDSISYKMIAQDLREDFTFKFFNISSVEAEALINLNHEYCVGAVGHVDFAKDLNRILAINYTIPYGRGRERVHLTLNEGDYVIIISRISNRATTYDKRGRYSPLLEPDDCIYTLAKVIKAPEVNYEIKSLNQFSEVTV